MFLIEEDNSVFLSSIHERFPLAVGVRFKTKYGAIRSIRVTDDGTLCPPRGVGDWSRIGEDDNVNSLRGYCCVYHADLVNTPRNKNPLKSKGVGKIGSYNLSSSNGDDTSAFDLKGLRTTLSDDKSKYSNYILFYSMTSKIHSISCY
jgi:hypothetical protein